MHKLSVGIVATTVAAIVTLSGTVAQAGTGTYTLSGRLNGSFNGTPFSRERFTFTMVTPTDGIVTLLDNGPPVEQLHPITSSTVTLAGLGTFTLLIPTGFSLDTSGAEAAFDEYEPEHRNIFIWGPGSPVDIKHSFGPIVSTGFTETVGDVIPTSGGDLKFDLFEGNSTLTFTGEVTGDVPEPATWAMMLTGFGITGTAARRRRGVRMVLA